MDQVLDQNQNLDQGDDDLMNKCLEIARKNLKIELKSFKTKRKYKEQILQDVDSHNKEIDGMKRESKEIENKIAEYEKINQEVEKNLKDLKSNIQESQQKVHWVKSKEKKEKIDKKVLNKKLQENLNFKLMEDKYRASRSKMNEIVTKKKSSSGPSAALVLFFLKNPFHDLKNKNKNNTKIPYMVKNLILIKFQSQVFSLTEKTRIIDLYQQALKFWNLETHDKKYLKEKSNTKRVKFSGAVGDDEDDKNDVRANDPNTQIFGRKYVLTDNDHNDLVYIFFL